MTIILRQLIIIIMLIYSAGWFAHGNDPENTFVIEKTVNQEILTNFDLGQRLSILKIFNVKLDKKQNNIEKLMVDEILQTQFANANGIQLTKNEFESQLEEFLRLNRIDIKELKTILIENSIEWASFEKFLYSKALWKKSLLQRFGKRAMISDFELNLPPSKKKINSLKLLDLSEIVIPFKELGKTKSLLLANRLRVELNTGGDFALAAKRFSKSQSRETGGNVGLIDEEKLPKQLKELLASLSENEISSPIISDKTVILFKLNKREERKIGPLVDYLMDYIIVEDKNTDGIKSCEKASPNSQNSMLLSKLDEKLSKILRVTNLYKLNSLDNSKWVILCKRKIKGSIQDINKRKSNYFNDQMINFSEKLMLKLYREAVIY